MDPNRNSLDFILKLPTHRLLNVYRRERDNNRFDYWEYDSPEPEVVDHMQKLKTIREELNRREHLK